MNDEHTQRQEQPEGPDAPRSDEGPAPELAEVMDDYIPSAAELAVIDPADQHEVMLRMDDHDVRMLLEQIQTNAMRRWVYQLSDSPGKPMGLTVHAVQDIVQRMNWTGKANVGLLVDDNGRPVLDVERIEEDGTPYWAVTAYAKDGATGTVLPGASMEPVRMKLRESTAAAKRKAGQTIPEDNTIFDPFSRWKAIQKATRNALSAFIPEEIKQSVIAMAAKDPKRVERIHTEAEQKIIDRPPALVDDEAKAKIARARSFYDEIRELGGEAVYEFPAGKFGAYVLSAQHSQESLDALVAFMEGERDRLVEKYGQGAAA